MGKYAKFSAIVKDYNFDLKKRGQLYKWARDNKIKSKKMGATVLFERETTSAFLESKGYSNSSKVLTSSVVKKPKRTIVSMSIPTPLGGELQSSDKIAMLFIPTSSLKEVLEIVLR